MKATFELTDITEWWDASHDLQRDPGVEIEAEPIPLISMTVTASEEPILSHYFGDVDDAGHGAAWHLAATVQEGHRDSLFNYLTHSNPAEGHWIYEGWTNYGDPGSRRVYESTVTLTDDAGTVIKG